MPGLDFATLQEIVADALKPAHFFVGPPASLEWQGPIREELPWEDFQGRLLGPAQTRQRRTFVSWNVFWSDETGRSEKPILAVLLDAASGEVHVCRAVLCYAWEGYDEGDNVILSRETTSWVLERVGTLSLARLADADELRRQLPALLFRAVMGTSRLPLTSVESPLPAFSLGRLGYFPVVEGTGPMRAWRELASRPASEPARVLETVLRAAAPSELDEAARLLGQRWPEAGTFPALLRTLFNEVSLSPWTGFVDNALSFVQALAHQGRLRPVDEVDFLSWLLRQLGRHLNAYDLTIFHHRGANYPDALLLDAALKRYLVLAESVPSLFTWRHVSNVPKSGSSQTCRHARLRRRALRQGWLLRRHYEGHPVPDAPTSPGERTRVLPPPHVRVPEEQILQPATRRHRLFADDPLDRQLGEQARLLLAESIRDLEHPDELRELGLGLFIDRPFAEGTHPLGQEESLLLSYEAFSRTVAEARLEELCQLAKQEVLAYREALARLEVRGLPLSSVSCAEGRIVSLADVRRAAEDFVLLRTTRQAVGAFLKQYDLSDLASRCDLDFLTRDRDGLIVPAPAGPDADKPILDIYDLELRKRLELHSTGWTVCE
jgi:hypothetical protein